MQGDWTVCAPLKYLIVVRLMPDIKEVKCFIFTAQIVPPLLGEGKIFFLHLQIWPPVDLILYTTLFGRHTKGSPH